MSANISINGRLGRDPETKFANSGTVITHLSVVSNTRKNVNGEWRDADTSWWDVKAFSALGEAVTEELRKGDLVTITGTIKQTKWTDKHGNERTSYEVLANTVAKQITPSRNHGKPRVKNDDPWQVSPQDIQEAVF